MKARCSDHNFNVWKARSWGGLPLEGDWLGYQCTNCEFGEYRPGIEVPVVFETDLQTSMRHIQEVLATLQNCSMHVTFHIS